MPCFPIYESYSTFCPCAAPCSDGSSDPSAGRPEFPEFLRPEFLELTWAVLHVGVKQLGIERLRRQFVPLMLFMLVAFGFGYYYFGKEGYDTATGLTSGLMANVIISGLYPVMMLRQPSLYGISTAVGWLKMVGTGLITVFTFMFFPDGHWFIKSMGLAVLVMDLYYLYLLYDRMRRDAAV